MNALAKIPTSPPTRRSEPLLSDRLSELLDSGDSPVIGPKSAAALQQWLDAAPVLDLITEDRLDNLVAKLALATKERKLSDTEAKSRLDLFWSVLRGLPIVDLGLAAKDILRTHTFMPAPAEVYRRAAAHRAKREYRKSRARHLIWKHGVEYRNPTPGMTDDDREKFVEILAKAGQPNSIKGD